MCTYNFDRLTPTDGQLGSNSVHIQLWPFDPKTLTSKINRNHPLVMGNTCSKSDKNTLNSFNSIVFTRWYLLLSIVTLTFDLLHNSLISRSRSAARTYGPQQHDYISTKTHCVGIIRLRIFVGVGHKNSIVSHLLCFTISLHSIMATFSQFFFVGQNRRQELSGMTSNTRPSRWSGSALVISGGYCTDRENTWRNK